MEVVVAVLGLFCFSVALTLSLCRSALHRHHFLSMPGLFAFFPCVWALFLLKSFPWKEVSPSAQHGWHPKLPSLSSPTFPIMCISLDFFLYLYILGTLLFLLGFP